MKLFDPVKRSLAKKVSTGVLVLSVMYMLPRLYDQAKGIVFVSTELARRAKKTWTSILNDIEDLKYYYKTGRERPVKKEH